MNQISSGKLMLLTPTWLALSLGGFVFWERHDRTPGATSQWSPELFDVARPVNSELKVMVFLHPHCPCARSTLKQLARCKSTCKVEFDLCIVFVRPPGADENWKIGESWRSALQIPGARLLTDIDGKLARAMGVRTSGHVVVQDSTNTIRFFGGITSGRGSEQECVAGRVFQSLISGEFVSMKPTDVFGCPLFDLNAIETGGN